MARVDDAVLEKCLPQSLVATRCVYARLKVVEVFERDRCVMNDATTELVDVILGEATAAEKTVCNVVVHAMGKLEHGSYPLVEEQTIRRKLDPC